jgi:hypothetical protein
MVGPRDAASSRWDALAPATSWDALAVPAGDALSATYVEPPTDALAVGYRADVLAAGGAATGDAAAGDAATRDVLAAPAIDGGVGDGFGDPLTAYADATAAGQPTGRPTPAHRPSPGPVPPRPADAGPADAAQAGRAGTGRRGTGRPSRGGGSTPSPRRAAASAGRTTSRTGSGGSTAGRTGRPGSAGASTGGHTTRPGSAAGGGYSGGSTTPARRDPAAGSSPYTGGAGTGRPGGAGTGRSGAGRGPAAGSGGSYRGPRDDVPGAGDQGPGWSPPWWANRIGRPTGTVPWEGGSGRSNWDDFFSGLGGSGGRSGKQPSGAQVARALLEAFRRGMRDR